MICPPCAEAADGMAAEIRADLLDGREPQPIGHPPKFCRDHAIQPAGCACAHRPAGTATPKETDRG